VQNQYKSLSLALTPFEKSLKCSLLNAGIAQLVERNLAKVEVASSSLVSRSKQLKKESICKSLSFFNLKAPYHWKHKGAIAKRLCRGLQSRLGRFDSGSRLHLFSLQLLPNSALLTSYLNLHKHCLNPNCPFLSAIDSG
jgi:hypothetical protein